MITNLDKQNIRLTETLKKLKGYGAVKIVFRGDSITYGQDTVTTINEIKSLNDETTSSGEIHKTTRAKQPFQNHLKHKLIRYSPAM